MSLWDWALDAYGRPGVAEAALAAQDRDGRIVSFLLWKAWADPDAATEARGAEIARAWSRAAIVPLREARRALKAPAPPVDDAAREGLREQVRAAELQAERLLLETLERLAGQGRAAADARAAFARSLS